ncbi:hypothetical protein [Actinomadura sp. NBRC 104412]|uniref:hypothetical protein n=1 Tax=Actinomadura sp. NBRC 104412 TaxID=3032203 RepID=UPI0025530C8B|nr:hypothetical protein [Actinomadura sp. NBRC 104412]
MSTVAEVIAGVDLVRPSRDHHGRHLWPGHACDLRSTSDPALTARIVAEVQEELATVEQAELGYLTAVPARP